MHPVLFEIPFIGYPISTFGVMLAIAFLVATWIGGIRMREEGLDPEQATTLLLYAMFGGIAGSKLYWAIDQTLRSDEAFLSLLFMRAGITFYGGLLGGTLAVTLGCRIHRIPVLALSRCIPTAAAVGQALGRIGCFLVGDDYGKPTDLPWGIAFPLGSPPTCDPVHPTQLYEMGWLALVAALLWRRRRASPFPFGEYVVLNGLGRVVIEFWRVNDPILGFTQPQWIGLALAALGTAGWLHYWRRARAAA